MLYIQASELVSKEVAINLLDRHLIMLYIQALELVSKEVAINWSTSLCSGSWLANQYVIYSGFRAG